MSLLHLDIRRDWPGFALDLQADLPMQGVTAIFGPSGCGKSTALRVIAGLERGATGSVRFGEETWQGKDRFTAPHKRGIGMVFQDARLFPHLSVQGNLAYAARRATGAGLAPDMGAAIAALDLAPLLPRRAPALSGGERQRVAIARALLTCPRLLLMDEPLSALDEARKSEILPYLERLRDAGGPPVLYVSHSMTEVARLADRVLVLKAGRNAGLGPLDKVLSDPAAMHLLGQREMGALLEARVRQHHADGLTELTHPAGPILLPRIDAAPGHVLRVRVLAHDVILSHEAPRGLSALNVLRGEISALRTGDGPGAAVQITLTGGDRLLARITRRSAESMGLATGQPIHAVLKSVAVAQADIGAGHAAPSP